MLPAKWAPVLSTKLPEFKVLQAEVENDKWWVVLMLTKSVTKLEIRSEQEC